MIRPVRLARIARLRSGFTLIEVLVATTLTLMLIGAVVSVFEMVSNSVSDARSTLEMSDRLRATSMQLQRDLAGVTVTMLPPRRPEDNEGYFEYVENSMLTTTGSGPSTRVLPDRLAQIAAYTPYPINSETGADDLSVGDTDDILMFTTRSPDRPFVGRFGAPTVATNVLESQVAEVAWFMRGRTLYRRELLVLPGVTVSIGAVGFYANYDLSVHAEPSGSSYLLKANTLGDLTKREYRFAHPFHVLEPVRYRANSAAGWPSPFPFDVRRWGLLRLPTLCETSSNTWWACLTFPTTGTVTQPGQRMPAGFPQLGSGTDLWRGPDGIVSDGTITTAQAFTNAGQYRVSNPWHQNYWDANSQTRCMDDVMLTNVLAFDVKVWDPGAPLFSRTVRTAAGTRVVTVAPGDPGYALSGNPTGYGAYVDLGYLPNYVPRSGYPRARFHVLNYDVSNGPRSGLQRIYDTWSTHYEYDGIPQFGGRTDWASDGLDNDGRNGVDDAGERETQAPYPYPLRSIQVKVRTFEPDSRQIRETTIVQDFMPQ